MKDARPSPYLLEDPPTSPGRAFLARAFAHWCALAHGFSAEEIAAALEGDAAADAAVARRVANATRLIGEVLAAGRLRAWARPMGGGIPEPIDPSLWELDDWRHRLATSAVALAKPFDQQAEPSHYVFVELDGFNAMIEEAFGDPRRVSPPSRAGGEVAQTPAGEAAAPHRRELDRLVRLPEVLRVTGMSRSTLYDRIGRDRFPAQADMEGNIAAWRESDIQAWLANPR